MNFLASALYEKLSNKHLLSPKSPLIRLFLILEVMAQLLHAHQLFVALVATHTPWTWKLSHPGPVNASTNDPRALGAVCLPSLP